jgi:hypothetical protein
MHQLQPTIHFTRTFNLLVRQLRKPFLLTLFLFICAINNLIGQTNDINNIDSLSVITKDSTQVKDTIVQNQPAFKSSTKQIIIEGKIIDFTTAEPLSFATVFFPGTSTGLKADIDGNFKFTLDKLPKDSLSVTVIGYTKKTIPLDSKSKYLKLKIEMERSSIMMRDFVIKFEKDPALNFVKKIIKNKSNNNYDKADNYSYEVYNKLEMDINKIPKKAFSKSPILKEFNFIEKYIDSTSEDKPFLPLFLTEK